MAYVVGEILYTGTDMRIARAAEAKSGAQVVLKLPYGDLPSQRALEELRHEYAVLRALEVPGVIRALGLEEHDRKPVLVLSSWGDTSLARVLDEGPLPVGVAMRLAATLARSLGEVHRRGILHRDIKPHNILVDAERTQTCLIDFELATWWTPTLAEPMSTEAVSGTLAYMAPEQTGRMNRAPDARADLYALGATLYQMLTGALPFDATDPLSLIHAHIARSPVPPHERAPERGIPEAVSAIVLKLMAKSPEDRYQTASGAAWDLERAARAWVETGTVAPFPLAKRDWDDRVRAPSRLFGREHETAALAALFDQACAGATVLSLVAGPSGVGKSALVQTLQGEVRARRGLFAAGKFDQLQRSTPYAAVAQALRSVVRRRLSDPAEVLERWRLAFQEAAGPNGQILVELMPELLHILGEPKPLVELGPMEEKLRFQATVLRFVRTLATVEHPLVLFIDDLQWADAASLSLLGELLKEPEGQHLLVVGAYRDEAVGPEHPLHALLLAPAAPGAATARIVLSPLDEEAVAAMVADMLDRPVPEVEELARLIKDKTDGSPFFVGQFLQLLHERKLLVRDAETGRWQWQRDAIERAGITDNVVSLLTRRLQRLSPELRRALQTAACVGDRFDAGLLAHLLGQEAVMVSALLAEASREGLVVHEGDRAHEAYAFVHDRVQQAAYEALTAEERLSLHLWIGRTLRARYGVACADGELFETLYHRNRAAERLTEAQEKRDLAEQNLRAGQRAKASAADAQAAAFLGTAASLLGEAGWTEAPETTFEVHLVMAEALWLAGQVHEGERLFWRCLERTTDPLDRARVASIFIVYLQVDGRFAQGIELGFEGMAWLGRPLPRTPEEQQALFGALIAEIEPALQRMTVEDWKALPMGTDRAHALRCRILEVLGPCSAFWMSSLSRCCWPMIVRETLQHGLTKSSFAGCVSTALLLTYILAKVSLGRRLHEAMLALLELYDVSRVTARFNSAVASMYWMPPSEVRAFYARATRTALEERDLVFEAYSEIQGEMFQLLAGADLDRTAHDLERMVYRDQMATGFRNVLSRSVAALAQAPAAQTAAQALEDITQVAKDTQSTVFRATTMAMAGFTGLHLGADAWALDTVLAIEPDWQVSWGTPMLVALTLTLCIAGAEALPAAPAEQRARREDRLAFHGARLTLWAESCPETFEAARLLMEAGRARARDEHDEAGRLYDQAIEQAQRHDLINAEALGLRLAGEHRLARGHRALGRAYLTAAHDAYLRWGARAAAAWLAQRYPDSITTSGRPALGAGEPPDAASLPKSTTITARTLNASLDIASVLRATQALSGDRNLESLVGRMLRLLAEYSGAERAVLALVQGGELVLAAELSVNPEHLELSLNEPVAGSTRLPATLVQYIARGKEPVVCGRAASDSRFDEDPYLLAHRPGSVLAVPLVHQGRLSGVMYLEHPHVQDAFPEARVELVTLLGALAATAVENATFYTELSAYSERLAREVAQRTAELVAAKEAADNANRAKSDFLSSMSHELRTPLNSILGYAQVLGKLPALPPKAADSARIIHTAGTHLLNLINDVLDLAKIEAGKLPFHLSAVDLDTLLRTVANLCSVRAEQKGLSFVYTYVGPKQLGVCADEKRLLQVLLNLLGNALKFTMHGGVTLRVEVQEPPEDHRRAVRFQIEDTGPGIAPEHLSRIFEAFEQVGDPRQHTEGSGLGLAITKELVERMGGHIEVHSQLGQGSVFTVTLRLLEATSVQGSAGLSWETILGYEGKRRSILVVDDNADNRALLRDLLQPIGFEWLEAESGERALVLTRERTPDVILMDLAMPGMDGYEATRRLRQRPELARTAIIASSASTSEAERRTSLRAGCDDFLPKPVQAGALLELLRATLQLEWVRRAEQGVAAPRAPRNDAEIHALTPPPAEELGRLLDLAERGLVSRVLGELDRLEASDARLGPWIGEVRAVAKNFQTKRLRSLLRTQLDATSQRVRA
ncbi:AAA family ATPase [Polyangium mundeleinium]|uniref:histidine kinase n=1 Tax=Polyangium mundeleinium TaxID=2995306 RepID=A0ABT5EVX6_9BACT|nr:AAA family ATPase [Polyangium mundeleinium]MDC0745462.1 AAA family ATPase [Polyangium mundeleinium]